MLVIGTGVVGDAITGELARYDLKIDVFEKKPGMGLGTSSRNSDVVHSHINYKLGTRRAVLNVRGNALMGG